MQSLQEYAGAPHNKGTLALVFTDIAGSTQLNNHFGDDEWLSMLLQHFGRARRLIEEHHGYLIKFIGDSCMVAFRTTVDAFQFSINFFVDTGHEFIGIRAGLHFGSVLIVGDDVYGSMVNLTSRIQHSVGGWIAISDPAFRDIKSVLGRSAPLMNEKRTVPPLKGFRLQPVWQISTDEMRKANVRRMRAKRSGGVPQGSVADILVPIPPNQVAGASPNPIRPVALPDPPKIQLYPRLRIPHTGEKDNK